MSWLLLILSIAGLAYIYLKNSKGIKPRGVGFKVSHAPKEDTLTQLETLQKKEDAGMPEKTVSIEKILNEAIAALEDEKDGEAERLFIQVIAINEKHPEANLKLGMLYLKNGLASKAELFLRTLSEEEPQNASHLSNLGYALFMQNRLAEAKETYEEALNLDASRAGRFASLAQVHMALREFDLAIGFLKNALSMEPRNIDFLLLLAECYYQMGQLRESMSTIDSILAVDAHNPEAKEFLQRIRNNNSVENL